MQEYRHRFRSELPYLYYQDLLNNLFRHPYIKIDYLRHGLGISRLTATKYLDLHDTHRLVKKYKLGIAG
jgi:hypothetical protein